MGHVLPNLVADGQRLGLVGGQTVAEFFFGVVLSSDQRLPSLRSVMSIIGVKLMVSHISTNAGQRAPYFFSVHNMLQAAYVYKCHVNACLVQSNARHVYAHHLHLHRPARTSSSSSSPEESKLSGLVLTLALCWRARQVVSKTLISASLEFFGNICWCVCRNV